jgi:hypothetical protein
VSIGPSLRSLIAMGRTIPGCETLASRPAIDALAEEHGIPKEARRDWDRLSRTQRLDCLATQMLDRDRQRRVQEVRARYPEYKGHDYKATVSRRKRMLAEARGSFLSAWQFADRQRHEVLFPHLDFLDRTFRSTDWQWDDGGWYGDAPTVIAEVLPALYDAMPRTRPDERVGVWWSPPRGTK